MEKKTFETIFQLQKKQPWLGDKYEELLSLLYQDCENDGERELLIDLLDRFTYLKEKDFNLAITSLCDRIVADPNLESSNTQLVSLTADNYSDSGQNILYALKARLERRDWREHLAINQFGTSYKEFVRNGSKHKKIVFVDEFIGSGRTVIGRVETLSRQYYEKNIQDIDIKVRVIAASSIGLKNQG